MLLLNSAALVAGLVGLVQPTVAAADPTQPTVRQLYELPNVFIENIAVRANGDLLLPTFDQGRIYTANPSNETSPPEVLTQVDGSTALLGIVEVSTDVFVISGGIFDPDLFAMEPGSMRLTLLKFNNCGNTSHSTPAVQTVAEVPDAGVLNGITALPSKKHVILGADSTSGNIWRVDTLTGHADIAFYDEELAVGPSGAFNLGVNGLKARGNYLYFTNTSKNRYGRVQIDEDGNKIAEAEIIADWGTSTSSGPDDFALDSEGNAYTAHWPGSLIKVTPEGEQTIIVNDVLVNPTSAVFSRDGKIIYMATSGRSTEPIVGGQVVEVRL
ncbi:hypothetical protein S7711_02892 [Stachybotrys chartarum IBT 7711]|uniref:SMP-30/Gluconolactonase/LRE-like region domain-containing protein n=1 Tax=Stachybotrys chartarum (strain CBS 109288 / IBT 7711) TaxID=1280523 RepID=A0A084AHB4_STACB|nr:hypothetical protein S7711_02892 [Stachybotrys chartarum IBT 7711]